MKKKFYNSSIKFKLITLVILPIIGFFVVSLNSLNTTYNQYIKYNEIILLIDKNKLSEQNKVQLLIDGFNFKDKKSIKNKLVEKSQSLENEIVLKFTIFILLLLVTFLIFFKIINYLSSSLNSIKLGLERFFNYLTSTEKDLDSINLKSEDEFGQMAKNLNFNIEKIKNGLAIDNKVINEAKFVSKMVGRGFLVYRINEKANNVYINELKDNFNNMIDDLRVNIVNSFQTSLSYANRDFSIKANKSDIGAILNTQLRCLNMIGTNNSEFLAMVNKNGKILDNKSDELLNLVNKLHLASINQAASLEETSAAVKEITSGITSTSTKAIHMLEIANSTKSFAKEGIKLVDNNQKSMNEINDATKAINDAISLIDKISFQTNILSLNAAVEAATAGEAGKGFAVVAQEVRNLAGRSSEAAKQIKELVELANEKSNDGMEYSLNMKENFEKLASMIEENTTIIDTVAKENKVQMNNLSQINLTMTSLDQITQENANMAAQTKNVAKQTNDVAEDMLKATKMNKYDLEVENRIDDFTWTLLLNGIKIEFTKYKQAILNQVNNNEANININVPAKNNIENFFKNYDSKEISSKDEYIKLKSISLNLDNILLAYGKAMKEKDELSIISNSNKVEEKLDEVFLLLNNLKRV